MAKYLMHLQSQLAKNQNNFHLEIAVFIVRLPLTEHHLIHRIQLHKHEKSNIVF